jgi:NTE family protein
LRRTGTAEADWASYVLFDGTFAGDLIELGRDDALRRAGEIRAFFG